MIKTKTGLLNMTNRQIPEVVPAAWAESPGQRIRAERPNQTHLGDASVPTAAKSDRAFGTAYTQLAQLPLYTKRRSRKSLSLA